MKIDNEEIQINKKLDLILEHNARVSKLYLNIQEDKWLTAALEQDIDILDKKLDWIAKGIVDLRIHREGGMSPEDLEKYFELFSDRNENKK